VEGKRVSDWKARRDERLRETIRLNEVPPASADRGVVLEWPDPAKFPELGPAGWRTIDERTSYREGGALREWVLARGDERLSIKVFVSSVGPQPARTFFEREALSPADASPPYQRDLSGEVLTLFLHVPFSDSPARNDALLLLFRNIVLSLRAFNGNVEVREIAARLLELARRQADVPFAEYLPPLPEPEDPKGGILPGQELTLDLPPQTPWKHGEAQYRLQVSTSGEAVDFTGLRDEKAWFRMLTPGEGRISLRAVDRRTLMSKEVQLGLDVKGGKE
jgi:hypothetical protein